MDNEFRNFSLKPRFTGKGTNKKKNSNTVGMQHIQQDIWRLEGQRAEDFGSARAAGIRSPEPGARERARKRSTASSATGRRSQLFEPQCPDAWTALVFFRSF